VCHLRSTLDEVSGWDAEAVELAIRFDQLGALATDLYPPLEPPERSNDSFTVGGERYPRFTAAVIAWADGPGGGHVSGRDVHGLLCSDTHPNSLAARINWWFGSTSTRAEQLVDLSYLDALVTAALRPCSAS
jgi:hypothetical protein